MFFPYKLQHVESRSPASYRDKHQAKMSIIIRIQFPLGFHASTFKVWHINKQQSISWLEITSIMPTYYNVIRALEELIFS